MQQFDFSNCQISRIAIVFYSPPRYKQTRACCGLSESCPKIGDVPKSPFTAVAALVPSAGTITLQIAKRSETGAVGIRVVTCPRAARRAPSLILKVKIMELPAMLQGDSLTRLLQGAAAGAVATMVVGFNWGGWSLGSTADKMAKERSELAVIAVLAPVCADKFRALPDAAAKQVALSKAESWKRRDEFPKEIVTLPGESYPSSALVDACSTLLLAPKSAALK